MQIASLKYSLFDADDLSTVKANIHYKKRKCEQTNKEGELRRGHVPWEDMSMPVSKKKEHTNLWVLSFLI